MRDSLPCPYRCGPDQQTRQGSGKELGIVKRSEWRVFWQRVNGHCPPTSNGWDFAVDTFNLITSMCLNVLL